MMENVRARHWRAASQARCCGGWGALESQEEGLGLHRARPSTGSSRGDEGWGLAASTPNKAPVGKQVMLMRLKSFEGRVFCLCHRHSC